MEQQAILTRKYCQTWEDEVIDGLLNQLGLLPGHGLAVEIGAGNGFGLSNTRHLLDRYGWDIVQIDAKSHPVVHQAFITAENVNHVLNACNVPAEFGVLSLDIDGNDWWVWNAIGRRPAVVCVEFNGACPVGEFMTIRYNPEFVYEPGDYYGASFAAMVKLGRMKGYRYVTQIHSLNAFFVRDDLAAAASIPENLTVPQVQHYHAHRKGEWVNPFEVPMPLPDPADAFSRDPFMAERFRELVDAHGIQTIVETGTYLGQTTVALAAMAPAVVTIESNTGYYADASYLESLLNVKRIKGDSPTIIGEILTSLEGPVMLFLDAHWKSPTPTPHELRAVAASGIKPAVIVVHDVQVPGHPELGFDTYDDFTYTWESLKPLMDAICGPGGYTHNFNDKAAGAMRGAVFVEVL